VPDEIWIKGGFGGNGFSGCTERIGKDIDLLTSSRYMLGAKIARIHGKEEKGKPTIEYFVETSQSHESNFNWSI